MLHTTIHLFLQFLSLSLMSVVDSEAKMLTEIEIIVREISYL